jgi:molybdenum cofactor cytidylyltransferase
MKTGLIILAAGGSSRMNGVSKQLLEFNGRSLLRRAAETALSSSCRPVLVVLGANVEKILPEIEDLPLIIELNKDWRQGMGSSIKAGLSKILKDTPELEAVILMLADQPLITAEILDRLAEAHSASGLPIIASEYENTVGVPALFSRPIFDKLLALPDDAGAKSLMQKDPANVKKIPVPEAAVDVDSEEDYYRLHLTR